MKKEPPYFTNEETKSKTGINEPRALSNNVNVSNKYPALTNKRNIFVIALDCYDDNGNVSPRMLEII